MIKKEIKTLSVEIRTLKNGIRVKQKSKEDASTLQSETYSKRRYARHVFSVYAEMRGKNFLLLEEGSKTKLSDKVRDGLKTSYEAKAQAILEAL